MRAEGGLQRPQPKLFVIDAAMHAWMLGPTYRAALNAGEAMTGAALAEVIESCVPQFSEAARADCRVRRGVEL
jgi:hypothetical protein